MIGPATATASDAARLAGAGDLVSPAGADDDVLALAHVAAQHFRRRPVAQPERERERRGLAVGPDHPDAAGGTAACLAGGRGDLLVARLLFVGEDLDMLTK